MIVLSETLRKALIEKLTARGDFFGMIGLDDRALKLHLMEVAALSLLDHLKEDAAVTPRKLEVVEAVKFNVDITKRELFSAMAMQGILSKPMMFITPPESQTESVQRMRTQVAKDAIANADALIAELKKESL